MSEKSQLELKIILDTSAIYSNSVTHLLSAEAANAITSSQSSIILNITWYLPEIVLLERHAQIKKQALELLPKAIKLEEILNNPSSLTAELIEQKTKEGVYNQAKEHNINVVSLDTGSVDWKSMMLRAVYKTPPFDPGEKEKGFRDALVAETVMQIISNFPNKSESCIVAVVIKDTLLRETIKGWLLEDSNIRFISSISELEGLIKTLETANVEGSRLTEAYLATRREIARKIFFESGNKDCLYYRENICSQIESKYHAILLPMLSVNEIVKKLYIGGWFILPPIFDGEDGLRLKWISQIIVQIVGTEFNADVFSPYTGKSPQGFILAKDTEISSEDIMIPSRYPEPERIPLGEITVGTGQAVFTVSWSVVESAGTQHLLKGQLEDAQLIEIAFLERVFGIG